MTLPEKQTLPFLALCALMAVVIFVVDGYLPRGIAGGVPYIVLVLMGLWLPWQRATLALAAIATVLTLADYFLSPAHGEPWIAWTNRGLALGAIWTTGVLGFLQKRTWQRLSDDEARLRVVSDTAIDGIVVIDADGIIEVANPACERMFGYSLPEMKGRNVSMLMPLPDCERHDNYIRRYLDTGQKRIIGIGREVMARRKDGTTFPIQLSVGEAWLSGRRIFTAFIQDISDHKLAQQKVQELQSDLHRISRLGELGEMAAAIAHEVNQPLTAVGNYIEAARQGLRRSGIVVPERVDELISRAVEQTERTSEVIRNIRALARREPTERAFADVNTVVREAAGLALLGAEAKGVSARMELAERLPPALINRTQVQQVVLNLVRNGVDALQECAVRQLLVTTTSTNDGHIEVSVADTGGGLSQDVREHLFKPFVTTKTGGMGIGLSVSRSIVDGHGGRLWAEAKEDGGTVFRFTLPSGAQGGSDHGE